MGELISHSACNQLSDSIIHCNAINAPVGGRLSLFARNWIKITSDPIVLSAVRGYKIKFDKEKTLELAQSKPRQFKRNASEAARINEEIVHLKENNVIEPCKHEEGEFISNVFLRPKKNGGVRLILDLSELNKALTYQHFKMDNIHTVLDRVSSNNFLASVDLRDAYYSVKIHPDDRKYLRFVSNNQCWQFKALPNGLSTAPRLFTKLLKPVFAVLRQAGHMVIGYLDDTILIGETEEKLKEAISATTDILTQLGFIVHPEKSVLVPIVFLGFKLNTETMKITLPDNKALEVKQLCIELVQTTKPSIRQVAKVIGKIISTFPAVQYGPLFYRTLERGKIHALRLNKGHFNRKMMLSAESKSELQWWIDNVTSSFAPIRRGKPDLELRTDASGAGWGATDLKSCTGGRWNEQESGKAKENGINYLETLAAGFGIKSFCANVENLHVLLRVDNTTAVTYINNMGGTKSSDCNEAAKDIWKWCMCKNIWITAAHLPGKLNVEADNMSRHFNDRTEWTLNEHAFKEIVHHFGQPDIDLFASRLNKQVSRYISWLPDPEAEAVDAFTVDWKSLNFYAFPPFCLISKCLQKIKCDDAMSLLVVPNWPTQPWLLVGEPMFISRRIDLLTQTVTNEHHPLHNQLDLLCCRCCANPWKVEV